LKFGAVVLLLLAMLGLLVLDGYLKDRARGKIERPVALFERLFPEKQGENQGEVHL